MKITKQAPAPVVAPPATYTIEGITEGQLREIVNFLRLDGTEYDGGQTLSRTRLNGKERGVYSFLSAASKVL